MTQVRVPTAVYLFRDSTPRVGDVAGWDSWDFYLLAFAHDDGSGVFGNPEACKVLEALRSNQPVSPDLLWRIAGIDWDYSDETRLGLAAAFQLLRKPRRQAILHLRDCGK